MQSKKTNRKQKLGTTPDGVFYLLRSGNLAAADELINDVLARSGDVMSVKPLLHNALHECGKLGEKDIAGWVVEKLLALGFRPDVFVFNRLLAACSRSGDVQAAVAWWSYLVALGARPNNITYNTMIHACAQANDSSSAVYWMTQLLDSDVQPCKISFATVISVFARNGHWQEAELWFSKMEELWLQPDTCIFNNLISACAKANKFSRAEFWLTRMESYGLSPDQKTYNTVINLCAKSGDLERATSIFSKMQDAGKEPDLFTFGPLLYACMMAADLQAAEDFMEDMEKLGIRPNLVCYNTIINCCAVCGDAERAMLWYGRLQDQGLQGRKITFSYLLAACVKAGRTDLTEKAFRYMSLCGFSMDSRDYAKLDEIRDGRSESYQRSLKSDVVDGFHRKEGDARYWSNDSGASTAAMTDVASQAIHVSREAWLTSYQTPPSPGDDVFWPTSYHAPSPPDGGDLYKDQVTPEPHSNSVEDEPLLIALQDTRVSNKIPAAKAEWIASTLECQGSDDTACNDLGSCATSLTSVEPTHSSDSADFVLESASAPHPSEIDCVALAWLNCDLET
eukprot:TRINITY_DN17942_c0_g2_i1.p1 TRINITY_DN17942_c0_g2~~TRINITY_DN17942_c0_g2_i1.p1  ORF type:complete len:586 (+),score=72.73 TRINITY_DN17942_c0_g2_i1:62-1759(+)